jgi:hypothetical protein
LSATPGPPTSRHLEFPGAAGRRWASSAVSPHASIRGQ